jgi:hypothetical protein
MTDSDYSDMFERPPRKRRRNRSVVVAVQTTRYYIYGKGYNSEILAYMQIAKHQVSRQCDADMNSALLRFGPFEQLSRREKELRHDLIWNWDKEWYAKRYPPKPDCPCWFCAKHHGATAFGIPNGRGCWFSKMADYRKIAREIISDIRLGFRAKDGAKLLALPVDTTHPSPIAIPIELMYCCEKWPNCTCVEDINRMTAAFMRGWND